MNKTLSIIITFVLIIGLGTIFYIQPNNTPAPTDTSTKTISSENIEIKDGVQYVTITARGGYSPKVSTAWANIPTKLIVKTNGTYDCSAALVIRSIGFQKILPQTGEEVIDLGTPQAGKMQGLCSMGMYSFVVNFN